MIADCITQSFIDLYSEQQVERPFPDVLEFPTISGDKDSWLERPFEEIEIFEVIKDFNGDKLLGPNGFPIAFFQSCQEILKPNLMVVFHHFFAKGQFEKSLSATFITFIPKKPAAVEFRDFHPISLVGEFIKLLLKLQLLDYTQSWEI